MLRAADLTPELVDAATEALLMSHRKFSETRLEAMRFTAQGRLLFGLLASIAQFEADLIRERTMLGLDRARAEGKALGRPTRVKPEQYALIQRMRAEGETHEVIARSTGLSKSTVGRVLRDEIPELIARFGDRTGDEADLFESPLAVLTGDVDRVSGRS